MSDDKVAPPKRGGKKKLLVMLGGALLLMGGGAAAGFYASGAGFGGHAAAEDPNMPKLVEREGAPEHGSASGPAGKPDMSRYKATYYPIEQTFTSNLRDSDGFAQIGIGVSTYYDERVIDHIKENEMPIRSAVLMVLADQDAMVISTPEGKAKLQSDMREAVNHVLEEKTGFGGVDSVYFTSFIIQ
jgi:flagellar protein FliL